MKKLALTYYSINLIIATMLFLLLPFINDNSLFLFDLLISIAVLVYALFGLLATLFIPDRYELEENYIILKELFWDLPEEESEQEPEPNFDFFLEQDTPPPEKLDLSLKIFR